MQLTALAAPALLLVLANAAPRCSDRPRPPDEPKIEAPAPAPAPETNKEPTSEPEPTPAPAEEDRQRPSVEQLAALDTYVGFSADGLLFAYSQMSAGAGLPVVSLQSSTTNTIEKVVPLAGMTARKALIGELDAEGFPRPGVPVKLPAEVTATLRDGLVHVMFGQVPATKPWKPFASLPGVEATGARVVAVSPDGQRVAVKVTAKGGGEFGPEAEFVVVKLFE